MMCIYTCPTIINLMKKLKLKIYFYDMFESNLEKKIKNIKDKVLVIIPIFYGFKPWINYIKLGQKFKNKIFILIDGAQAAYSHLEYRTPLKGAILSCPHKSLGINDGSILRLSKIDAIQRINYNCLKKEKRFNKIKKNSRILLNSSDTQKEKKGLILSKKLENWKSLPPKKISSISLQKFLNIDQDKHRIIRIKNYKFILKNLGKYFPKIKNLQLGTPFGYPLLFEKREKLLQILHKERVFASPLWHNNRYVNKKFKNAYLFKKNFLSLPLDQRYTIKDLKEMIKRVKFALRKIK